MDFEGNVNAMWAEYAGEADYAAYADCDAEGNNIPETYATKEELTEPKEVIHLANGMRIESREEGIYLVSPEDREQEIEECSYLLINKYDAITDLVAKYAEFAYETEYALYAEHSATADMDSEERTLKGVYIEELDLDEAIDISEIEIFDGYIASLGLVNRPLEILLPPEKQYQYVGFTSAMYFATPSEIPENYTQFPDVIHFKGDSVVDGRLVPEPNMRYTIVFDFDGYMLNAYVSGVTTV